MEQKNQIESEVLKQMREIMQEKHLEYVQFHVRFVDAILPNPRTGKKTLIVAAETKEMEELV